LSLRSAAATELLQRFAKVFDRQPAPRLSLCCALQEHAVDGEAQELKK